MAKRMFDIPVVWMMAGTEHVEAETLPEALRIILEGPARPLPDNGWFISGSYEVEDTTTILEANGITSPLSVTETKLLVQELNIRFSKIYGTPNQELSSITNEELLEHLCVFRGEKVEIVQNG